MIVAGNADKICAFDLKNIIQIVLYWDLWYCIILEYVLYGFRNPCKYYENEIVFATKR